MLTSPTSWRLAVVVGDDAVVVQLIGAAISLHEEDVNALREHLFRLAEALEGRRLILDLGNVEFLTSSTIEVLLALRRLLRARGSALSLCNLTPVIAEVFASLSLNDLLEVHTRLPRSVP